jgi:CTP synthase (UTP-ammonia lyase)
MTRIALLGEFSPTFRPHLATNEAIQHCVAAFGLSVTTDWISTRDIEAGLFERCGAIWIAPGSPYKDLERTLWAIRYAREHKVPCFGTCGGFQHIILEYARNVLGFKDAHHAEYDPYASDLFVTELECSLAGQEMRVALVPGSRAAEAYGALTVTEEYYCNFGMNPSRVPLFQNSVLKITGSDPEGEIRVVELPDHPFFLATLFVPQARSTRDNPHPLVRRFLTVAAGKAPAATASTVA